MSDVLTDDNFSSEQMIEVVGDDIIDDKMTRTSRTHLKSTTPKLNEFKDWRGKITQPNLPEYENLHFLFRKCLFYISVRSRLRRQHSASVVSPQRPCTAASNLSKSRPESSSIHLNDSGKEKEQEQEEEDIVRKINLLIC